SFIAANKTQTMCEPLCGFSGHTLSVTMTLLGASGGTGIAMTLLSLIATCMPVTPLCTPAALICIHVFTVLSSTLLFLRLGYVVESFHSRYKVQTIITEMFRGREITVPSSIARGVFTGLLVCC
ncbi:MAG: hypothetical protein P4L95_07220, partial [Rouxiella aceris]|uniref:hypothetical protein n=1 Tax=Rouxiella aceris TaxID=2703884 RepID=UPI00284D6342